MALMLVCLLLLISPIATLARPNSILLDFKKRELWHPPRSLQRRAAADTGVFNAQSSLMYLVNVTIGNPPQALQLQLDTGSSDVWVPSSTSGPCRRRRCVEGAFSPDQSKTFTTLDSGVFRIKYVDGTEIRGDYISDTVGIAGLSVDNMTMGLAKVAAEQDALGPFEGILGLGFEHGESVFGQTGQTYPNLLSKMKKSGTIAKRAYSLWLNDKLNGQGSILFGGVDTEKYSGELVALPIQPDIRTNAVMSFTVALDNFFVVDASNDVAYKKSSLSLPVILDSGTTITYLPDNIAHDIYVGVGAVVSKIYGVVVPCSVQDATATLNFGFGNPNGPVISANLGHFVLPFPSDLPSIHFSTTGDEACRFGLQAAGGRPLLFGDTFLRAAYVVYNVDGRQVAIANARFNVSSSRIVDFSGASIPHVTSTASGSAAYTAAANHGTHSVSWGSGSPNIATRPSGTFKLGTPTARPGGRGHGRAGDGGPGHKDGAVGFGSPSVGAAAMAALAAVTTSGILFGGALVHRL